MTITNEGNVATTYALVARGEGAGARFATVPDEGDARYPKPGRFVDELRHSVAVAPGASREVAIAVRARQRPWLARRMEPIPLTVTVTGDGDRRHWAGQLNPAPVLPWWPALALAGVLLLLCMAATLLLSIAGYSNRQTLILTRQAASTRAAADDDGDSLSNAEEVLNHHTRPDMLDTDGDERSDNVELINQTDPLHFDENSAPPVATTPLSTTPDASATAAPSSTPATSTPTTGESN